MTFSEYAATHGHDKYPWYLEVYDQLITPWAHVPFRLLEIGCSERSLQTWLDVLPLAEVVGLDLEPGGARGGSDDLAALAGENERLTFVQGDQANPAMHELLGSFNFVIDDGGHYQSLQRASFEGLFPRMHAGGWYFVEDVHAAYAARYRDTDATTVDLLRELIDDMHVRYVDDWPPLKGDERLDDRPPTPTQRWPIREFRLVDSLLAIQRSAS